MENTKETLKILKENLKTTQNRIKHKENQHQSERKFEEGDSIHFRDFNCISIILSNKRIIKN